MSQQPFVLPSWDDAPKVLERLINEGIASYVVSLYGDPGLKSPQDLLETHREAQKLLKKAKWRNRIFTCLVGVLCLGCILTIPYVSEFSLPLQWTYGLAVAVAVFLLPGIDPDYWDKGPGVRRAESKITSAQARAHDFIFWVHVLSSKLGLPFDFCIRFLTKTHAEGHVNTQLERRAFEVRKRQAELKASTREDAKVHIDLATAVITAEGEFHGLYSYFSSLGFSLKSTGVYLQAAADELAAWLQQGRTTDEIESA